MKYTILFLLLGTTGCTSYNYIGDPQLMPPPKKWDTIQQVIIPPIPNSLLLRQYMNVYPGADIYLIPKRNRQYIDSSWHDMQHFIDSCILAIEFKPKNI